MSNLSYFGYTEKDTGSTLTGVNSCVLSSTRAVETISSGGNLYIRVISISGSTILFNPTSISLGAGSFSEMQSICALSSSTFVVVYKGANDYLYAMAGLVSGTSIISGTVVNVSGTTAVSGSFSITNMASNSYVIAYCDSSNTKIMLRAGTEASRELTLGTAVTGYASNSNLPVVKALSTTAFILTNSDVSGNLVIRPCTLSIRTITANTASTISDASASFYPIMAILSSTKFVVLTYNTSGNLGAIVCTTNNSTITANSFQNLFGTTYQLRGANFFNISSSLVGICLSDSNSSLSYATTINIGTTTASINSSDTIQIPGALATNLSYITAGTITLGSQYLITVINYVSTYTEAAYFINYSTGKKRWGITISKWNGISPSKINGI